MSNPFDRGAVAAAPTPPSPPAPAPVAAAPAPPAGLGAPAAPAPPAGLGSVASVQSGDPYSVGTPSGISGLAMSDPGVLNQLLLVEPIEYIASMNTAASKEPTDAVRANILPLTGPLADQLQEDVMIFQVALKRELKKTYQSANKWLLAYLHMGTAKPGQSAPYLFAAPSDEQAAYFEKWKAARTAG